MCKEPRIVELNEHNEPEYMEIIIKAFQDSPQVPILINKPQYTEIIIRNLIKVYNKTGSIKIFGIKKDKKIICVGLCIDSDTKPGFLNVIKFGFSIFITLGFRGLHQFWLYNKNKPTYNKKCLELLFYGTRTMFQKKGYGRSMLNFLYGYAKKNRYEGVIGVTNTTRPAFNFYRKEGWIVDKQFLVDDDKICWVRRIV